ncbi:MAG TPA: HAMP domain-containing sensor histidine kinase, partial [Gaiellaceae bacterium]|nr:HAMP domain-containing sensor histidine kinase [Gaiellaceae bacterium]
MTLRARLTLVAAGVVAIVVALACATTYFVMRHELYSQVDTQLTEHAHNPQTNYEGFNPYQQDFVAIVLPDGNRTLNSARLPVDEDIRAVAAGKKRGFFRNTTLHGVVAATGRKFVLHARERVLPISGGAVVVARDIGYIHHDLGRLRLILILVSLAGVLIAAAAGALVSGATLAPVRRLTAAAERIAKTGEPSERVPEGGRGEIARLGRAFNTMLSSLEESLETQRRFVADASHELRTPLTSLQTNIDVLRGDVELEPEQRQRLLDDLHRESQEMRALIAGLLELARGGAPVEKKEFHFDELVEDTLQRARTRFPTVTWEAGNLQPTIVDGYRDRMERAVWNLLENAGKWSGEGGSVEVSLLDGELRVRDHGPGFADEDRPLVFDRFYRSAAARSMPGSGLGLAIVQEVAEAHGGTVEAENAR